MALIAHVPDARWSSLTARRSVRCQKASLLNALDCTRFVGRISKVTVTVKSR